MWDGTVVWGSEQEMKSLEPDEFVGLSFKKPFDLKKCFALFFVLSEYKNESTNIIKLRTKYLNPQKIKTSGAHLYTKPIHKNHKNCENFSFIMFRSLIRPRLIRGVIGARTMRPTMALTLPGVRFISTNEKLSEITTELSQFTDELPLQSPLTSDQLGYLDSIGLAQGFGPTAMVERVLEYAHVYTGLPWWATIVGVSLSLRFVMFPLYVRATRNAAKVSKIKPELDDIMRGLRNAENPQEQAELTRRRQKLSKDNDIHMTHQFLPAVSQIVFGYASYQALTKMARFPVQGFSEQGAYWFQDLSQVDPYLGLQVISAAAFLAMFKLGSKAGMSEFGPTQMSAPMQKLMYAMPIVTIFITKNLPAAFILYLATNSIFSIFQSLIFNNKTCRNWLKIPPMVRHAPKPQDNNLGDWWKDFKDQTNKNTQKNMRQSDRRLAARRKRNLDSNNNYIKRH